VAHVWVSKFALETGIHWILSPYITQRTKGNQKMAQRETIQPSSHVKAHATFTKGKQRLSINDESEASKIV
jgi:hypothetical protein